MSALNTGTYKWVKFFVPLLRYLTSNEFTLKDSFELAEIICEQDAGLSMASLEVVFLFANIPLEGIIVIFVLMSYSKVIVAFTVLRKNRLLRCFL